MATRHAVATVQHAFNIQQGNMLMRGAITEVLAQLLTPGQVRLLTLLAEHAEWPSNGKGLVSALARVAASLKSLDIVTDISGLHELAEKLGQIHGALVSTTNMPSYVLVSPDETELTPTARLWFAKPCPEYAAEELTAVLAAMGACLLSGVAQGKVLNKGIAKVFLHVLDGDYLDDWRSLVPGLAMTNEGIAALLLDGTIKKDLHRMLVQTQAALKHIRTGYAQKLSGMAMDMDPEPANTVDAESKDIKAQDGLETQEGEEKAELGNLCRWLNSKATRAGFASIVGVPHWDVLSLVQLKDETRRLAKAVAENPALMPLGVLAIYSLVSGLPPVHVLDLGFEPNGDLYIDPESGAVVHDLDAIVHREEIPSAKAMHTCGASTIVRVAPPQNFAQFVAETFSGATVEDFKGLLFPGKDKKFVQVVYGQFLRSLPDDEAHLPYSVRFASSFGQAICDLTANPVLAAVIAQDYAKSAPAEIDYTCIHTEQIHETLSLVYRELGLEPPEKKESGGYVGSRFCPTEEAIREGMQLLRDRAEAIIRGINNKTKPEYFVESFNQLNLVNASALVVGALLRGKKLRNLAWQSLYASEDAMSQNDKETSHCAERLIHKTDFIEGVLTSQRGLLESFALRMECHYPSGARHVGAMLDGQLPRAPVFLQARIEGGRLKLFSVRTKDLESVLSSVNLYVNAGRHFGVSLAVRRGIPIPALRGITGHGRFGAHGVSEISGLSPEQVAKAGGEFLSEVHKEYFPASWPTLRRPSPKIPLVKMGPAMALRGNAFKPDQPAPWPEMDNHISTEMLPAVSRVGIVRKLLYGGAPGLSGGAALLLSMTSVDGIAHSFAAEAAWKALMGDGARRLGKGVVVTWTDQDKRVISQPVQPLTQIYLACALREGNAHPFDGARYEVVAALRNQFPADAWHEDDQVAFHQWCWWCQLHATYVLPPWVVKGSDPSFHAAAMSAPSIARLGFGRALAPESSAVASVTRKRSTSLEGAVKDLMNDLMECGDNEIPVGEDDSRRSEFIKLHAEWKKNYPCPADEVGGLAEWVIAEIDPFAPGAPLKKDLLEVGSVHDYAGVLVRGVLEIGADPLDYESEDWERLKIVVLENREGDQYTQKLSMIRRLAQYCCRRGSFTSVEPLSLVEVPEALEPVRSASITYISATECGSLIPAAKAEFGGDSIQGLKAAAYVALCAEHTFRPGEPMRLALDHFSPLTQGVSVTTTYYSHLKKKKFSTRRTLHLQTATVGLVSEVHARLSSLPEPPEFFFLGSPDKAGFIFINQVHSWLSAKMKEMTGEKVARPYCLRGSNEARLVFPQLEEVVRSIREGCLPPEDGRSILGQWRTVHAASAVSGHHPLSSILSYLAVWPIVRYYYLRMSLTKDGPTSGLAQRIPGLKPDNLRQIVSRSRAGK